MRQNELRSIINIHNDLLGIDQLSLAIWENLPRNQGNIYPYDSPTEFSGSTDSMLSEIGSVEFMKIIPLEEMFTHALFLQKRYIGTNFLKASLRVRQRRLNSLQSGHEWKVVEPLSRSTKYFSGSINGQTTDLDVTRLFYKHTPPDWLLRCGVVSFIRRVMLPVGFPESVSSNYSVFLRYNVVQVVCISITRILATQSMLLAVGIGQAGALPMAAVVNWILKDGLGHIGSILVGTSINTRFDSEPKRYKFYSVVCGQVANLLGILSLWKPLLFLPLTACSSAMSRIATLAYVSSRARIYEDFCRSGNLGDVIRCSQAQSTIATIIGTAIGVCMTPLIGANVVHILTVFAPLSVYSHWLAFKAVSAVEICTLNRQRMERVIKQYMDSGCTIVPTVSEVSRVETFIHAYTTAFPNVVVNPEITSESITTAVVEALSKETVYTADDGSIYATTGVVPEKLIQSFFIACMQSEKKALTNWEHFRAGLVEGGWKLNVAFLDDPGRRLFIEESPQ